MFLKDNPEAKLTEGVSIDDYSTWRAVRLRSEMRSAERAGKSAVFLCPQRRKSLPRAQRGGWGMIRTSNAAKPLSSICLIPLWLAVLKRPSSFGRGRKAGT